MTTRTLRLAIAFAAGTTALRAQTPAFTTQRDISVDSAGWHRLTLDAAVLAAGQPFRVIGGSTAPSTMVAASGLNDLRLFDQAGREVPYLLVYPPQTLQEQTRAIPLPITPKKFSSGFEVDLGAPRPVDGVEVAGLPAPFLKRVQLEGSGDRERWTLLLDQGTLFDLPKEGMRNVQLDFTPGTYRYLRLTWDDSTSARMPLPPMVRVRSASSLAAPTAALAVPAGVERRASEPGVSRYALRLPGAHLPIVAIRVVVRDSNVFRVARVSEARLTGGDLYPQVLGSAMLKRTVRGGVVAAALDIPIIPPLEDRLELAVDDGNNPPLAIVSVSAVFAQLPFVVFSTPDARALTAKYGAPSLGVPRYDLEALRDSAASLAFTAAHWGDAVHLTPSADARGGEGVPMIGAPIDVERFRWSRAIADTSPGLATLPLDAAVLAHSRLVDLRIVDAQDRQVPYLFEHMSGPLDDTLPALEPIASPERSTTEAGVVSRYRIHLPYDSLAGAHLVLHTSARVFRRHVRLLIPALETQRREPGTLISANQADWVHAEQETPAPALALDLPRIGKDDAVLEVQEGDNTPLPLDAPELLLPGYRLRFVGDGTGALRLMYGRHDLATPRYDIALLAPRLIGVPATDVAMATEGNALTPPTNAIPVRIFWGALVAAVLVLLVIVAKLVRAEPAPAAEGAK